ncbi:hypothetical protein [Cellulosilyticum ruminicola]|uniref:hypothetical protein n=1 Tax=Cellulosilyticum ruminicola TaxID=425254 RepID=UPI0006D14671|nr:hypothetical protein [Cellulosilyticum ruminicola]
MERELKILLEEAGFNVQIMKERDQKFNQIKGLIVNNNLKFIYEIEEDGTMMIRQIKVADAYLNLGYTTRLLEFLSKQNEYNVILPFVTTPKLAHICDKLNIQRDDSCIEKYGYNSAFYSIAKNYAFYEGKYGHYVVRKLGE